MKNKRIVIVTGAYGEIGKEIAKSISRNLHYEVILVGRNENKLINAVNEIQKSTSNKLTRYKVVDLSSKKSIEDLAAKWEGPLHVIVNNAGTTPRRRIETPEGIEMQFATNVLGYFWMIKYMSKFMNNVEDARIVNVASYWAGGLYIDDVEFKNRHYNNDSAYRQSKQANRMLSTYYASILAPEGIKVNACHPGEVNSKLSNDLGFGGHESPSKGAETPVWLAVSDEAINITGKYFEYLQQRICSFSNDKKQMEQLYKLCEKY